MPAQTREATIFARKYQHNPVPSSPSRDYQFAWCYMRSLNTKWQGLPCFPPLLCKQVIKYWRQQVLDCSVNSLFVHKPACIDKGGEIQHMQVSTQAEKRNVNLKSWCLPFFQTAPLCKAVAQRRPGPAKSTMFVPFVSYNLVRSARERLAYSQVPGQYE